MIISSRKWLLPLVTATCFLGAFSVNASLLQAVPQMGDLLRWGAFSLGGGVTSADTIDEFVGTTDIYGDVGVAGDGNITMTGNATIHGDLWWRSNGTLSMKGNSKVTGNQRHGATYDSQLDNGVTYANNASTQAASFSSSLAYAGITSITSSLTLNAQHDMPGNKTVLNITDLVLTSHSVLTLNGTASDVFIINVSKNFSLTAQSAIVLTGGLGWDDVLFNVKGKGGDVTLDGQSTLNGVLMATQRTINNAGGSTIRGEAIANKIKLAGSAQIIHPPATSP
jgi:hypothetical protein